MARAIRPAPKPPKKAKKASRLAGGGRAPRKAGIKQESNFVNAHDGFRRVVGSGAFGIHDPLLKGDIKGEIGRRKFLLEMKAWATVDGKGEKTINIPLSTLDKVRQEAQVELPPRHAGVIFHPKNTSRWIAIFDWADLYQMLREQEEYIMKLESIVNAG